MHKLEHSVEVVKPGFFSRNYEIYVIDNPLNGVTVRRRQNDFNELRKNLLKLYPGAAIPSMPTGPIQKLEAEFMDERKELLQTFIDKVAAHPLLRTSRMVWDFLSVEGEKQYEQIRQRDSEAAVPKEVSQLVTESGFANVAFDELLVQNCQDIELGLDAIFKEFYK